MSKYYTFTFLDVCHYIDILFYESYFVSTKYYKIVQKEDWFYDNELFRWYDHPVIPYMMDLDNQPKNEDLHTFVFELFLSQPPILHTTVDMLNLARDHYYYKV
jgi:hypothetical protein